MTHTDPWYTPCRYFIKNKIPTTRASCGWERGTFMIGLIEMYKVAAVTDPTAAAEFLQFTKVPLPPPTCTHAHHPGYINRPDGLTVASVLVWFTF